MTLGTINWPWIEAHGSEKEEEEEEDGHPNHALCSQEQTRSKRGSCETPVDSDIFL